MATNATHPTEEQPMTTTDHTIVRACSYCNVKRGNFDRTYVLTNEYECRNCGLRRVVNPRSKSVGGKQQELAVGRISKLLGARWTITKQDDESGIWRKNGVVALTATNSKWFEESLLLYVGPRGRLNMTICNSQSTRKSAKAAWRWLRVVGDRKDI